MSGLRLYFVPATLATLLHVTLLALFVVGFSMPTAPPVRPLAIQATLVLDEATAPPPVAREEPEPEPEIVEPAPAPEPEIDQAAIEAAEEQKRLEDARIEQERLSRIEEAKRKADEERKRIAEEEEARKKAAEAERKRLEDEARRKREEEERKEQARIEAERKRQEDIERQRLENERRRREAEAAARQDEIDAESRRLDLIASGARDAYVFAIQQDIERNWVKPASARPGLNCTVAVRQLPGGDVVNVSVQSCNGDAAVVRSIESAVYKASPLPQPSDPSIFERNLTIIFKPEQ